MSQPRCLMLDEPSIGLAPKLFQDLLQPDPRAAAQIGMSIIWSSRTCSEALKISDRVVVMKAGAIVSTPSRKNSRQRALMELYEGSREW